MAKKLEKADTSISVLIEKFNAGELGIPEIQRDYVWNKSQVKDLVESLYKEYPTGLIYLWKTKTLPKLKENSIKSPDLLILDGQQRLTSLQKLLKGEIPVYFNVEDESFAIYSSKLKNVPSWVAVKSVLENPITIWNDIIEKLKIDKTSRLQEDYMNRIQNLSQIKDYSFPVLTLHTDDFEEVTESFIRLNSKGTRLKFAELAMARLAFNWPGALNDEFKIALTEYEKISFDFSPSFLMRCFVVIGTDQSSFKTLDTLWNERKNNLPSIWEKTKKSISTTINFLKNNVGIGSSDFIPSTNALVPIVYYVNKFNSKLDDDSINGILFWYLAVTGLGRFTGGAEAQIDNDIKAINSEAPIQNLVKNLRRSVAIFEFTPEMIAGEYRTNKFMPLLFSLCRKKEAKDWFNGINLNTSNHGSENQIELHHIFPKAILKEAEIETELVDDLANIAFLSSKANKEISKTLPSKYLKKIETDRLKKQFIPIYEELWEITRFKDFLQERRKLIIKELNIYFAEIGKSFIEN
ncbi:DUF262 domain-containing protein [Leptospira weilii]|uniref:DUF262 domain-containing protein n=1 Tax=Leptospira weilii TaxID=28184 RepID=UPI0009C0AD09|nr:DUF262 domain-containing protein [Leptospira weilii]